MQHSGYSGRSFQPQRKNSLSSSSSNQYQNSIGREKSLKNPNTSSSSSSSMNPSQPSTSDDYSQGTFEVGKYKTKLCRHWKTGYCLFGPNCVFAHGVDDLCEPNLLMTQMNNLVLVPLNIPAAYCPVPVYQNEAGLGNSSIANTPMHMLPLFPPNSLPIQLPMQMNSNTLPLSSSMQLPSLNISNTSSLSSISTPSTSEQPSLFPSYESFHSPQVQKKDSSQNFSSGSSTNPTNSASSSSSNNPSYRTNYLPRTKLTPPVEVSLS